MRYLMYGAAFMGLAVGSELLFYLYRVLRKPKRRTISKVLVFSDTCGTCGAPLMKKHSGQCCREGLEQMAGWVEHARHSLDVCVYLFTCDRLLGAVLGAHSRGVAVRLITDSHMAFATNSVIPDLQAAGIPIRWKESNAAMHHKFCIMDCPERVRELGAGVGGGGAGGWVLCGSLNWTAQGWGGNWENLLITSSPPLLQDFHACFCRLWEDFAPFPVTPIREAEPQCPTSCNFPPPL